MAVSETSNDIERNNAAHERSPLLATGNREPEEREQAEHIDSETVEELSSSASSEDSKEELGNTVITVIFMVLLLGCFLANAIGAVVLATNQHIASEFNALSSAAWLITIYTLAQCASQPLYGRLTDIFGARKNLAFCWLTFTAGDLIVATSRTFLQALIGRSVSGIGSSGMISLASVVITDLVPVREVASYRAYINVTATVTRSMGGPIGAWVAGSTSWRWCFIIPCPVTLCDLIFILWKLPEVGKAKGEEESPGSRLGRVDFLGAAALVGLVLSFLPLLDRATKNAPLTVVIPLGAATFVFLVSFIVVERSFANEPMLPLGLLAKRDVYMPYLIVARKSGGQFTFLYSIPLYFIIVEREGVASAGTRIVPVVVGNAIGTILSGRLISKSQRYKTLTLCAIGTALAGWLLILLRWNGRINIVESLYVV